MSEQACQNCRFAKEKSVDLYSAETVYSCHRFPPVFVPIRFDNDNSDVCQDVSVWVHPCVAEDHWCGEFVANDQHGERGAT